MLFRLQKIWHMLYSFIHSYLLSNWLLCYRNYSKCYIWWYNRHGSCHCGVYNLIVVTINGNYLNIEVQTLTKVIKNQRELWEKFTGWGWGVRSDQLELRHNKLPCGITLQLRPPCKREFFAGGPGALQGHDFRRFTECKGETGSWMLPCQYPLPTPSSTSYLWFPWQKIPFHHLPPNHQSWLSWGFNCSAILLLFRNTADLWSRVLYSRQGPLSSFCWDSSHIKRQISLTF